MTQIQDPSREELMAVYNAKYCRLGEPGWSPRMRLSFGYFSPDDVYEALVSRLVTPGCVWADVGCGRNIFPQNPKLETELAQRCGFLLGIDPDANILENQLLTESFQGLVDDYVPSRAFDLVTLRMVAEHITDPDRAMRSIGRMLKPGGIAVMYTPYKWAPVSIMASLVPFALHFPIKKLLWGGESRVTFPTAFRLNTRRDLAKHANNHGLREIYFSLLDDCRTFARIRPLSYLELLIRKGLNGIGVRYPESCILAAYRKG